MVLFVALRMIWEGGHDVWEASGCDATFRCLPALRQALGDRIAELFHRIGVLRS